MRNRKKYVKSLIVVLVMIFFITNTNAQTYSQRTIISSGGERATGGNYYKNFGIVGQPFREANNAGSNYNEHAGFLNNYDVSLDVTKPLLSRNNLPEIFPSTSSGVEASVTVIDNIGVTEVTFNSKNANQTNFQSTPVAYTPDKYSHIILPSDITDVGLEYYFLCKDANKNQDSTDTMLLVIEYNSVSESPPIENLGIGGKPEDWRMFSIPYELDDDDIKTPFNILGNYDNTQWRIVHYQDDKVKFIEYDGDLKKIERGKSYWFNSIEPVSLKVGPSESPGNTSKNPLEITLNEGWTQIGNPYTFDLSWQTILDFNSDLPFIDDVADSLRIFSGGTELTSTLNLEAFSGAYVYSDNEITLKFPLIDTGSSNIIELNDQEIDAWQLQIKAIAGNFINNISGLGMHPNATESKDQFDRIRVPRFVKYVDLTFSHPEYEFQNFAMDIVPEKDNYTWEFTVESNIDVEYVTLSWNEVDVDPEIFVLLDPDNDALIDLRDQKSYTFRKTDSKKMKVIYGSKEYLTSEMNDNQVLLGNNYPNPFNDHTVIPFSIFGKDKEYDIELNVYDLRGNLIDKIIQTSVSSGPHEFEWDPVTQGRQIPPGLYIYSLKVNSKNLHRILYKRMLIE